MSSVRSTAPCSREGCTEPVKARGLCSAHYQHARYHGRLDEVAPNGQRPCLQCGKIVAGRRWKAMYCSIACNERAAYLRRTADVERQATLCAYCGKELTGRRDQRFCSNACGVSWRNREHAKAERAARLATLPPCPGCGGPIGLGRRSFCSDQCKVDARRAVTYGMTVRDFHDLMERQDHACAVCSTTEWGAKGPQIDHCHTSGRVRGVLCTNCNNGLGRFKDDSVRLRRAADYLEANP